MTIYMHEIKKYFQKEGIIDKDGNWEIYPKQYSSDQII